MVHDDFTFAPKSINLFAFPEIMALLILFYVLNDYCIVLSLFTRNMFYYQYLK